MTGRPPLRTRRQMLGLLGVFTTVTASDLAAQTAGRDRGIGGTGLAPTSGSGEDRGIGGTGFVGTIQRFGSIIVNDARITYPAHVAVRIDGKARRASDLRIGHVVHAVAVPESDRLTTRTIIVESEVVGPILSLAENTIEVMGQTVWIGTIARAPWWRKGVRVAVSGLRRADGLIVASLIERRPAGPARVSGILERDEDGYWIAGLKLVAADETLLGQRVTVTGRLTRGGLRPSSFRLAETSYGGRSVDRLSLESYVRAEGDVLRLASGQTVSGVPVSSELAYGGETRAILDTRIAVDGRLVLESIRISNAGGNGEGSGGAGSNAGPGGGPGPGPGGSPGGPGGGAAGGGHGGGHGGGGPGGGPGGGGPGGGGPGGGGPGGGGGGRGGP